MSSITTHETTRGRLQLLHSYKVNVQVRESSKVGTCQVQQIWVEALRAEARQINYVAGIVGCFPFP